MALSGVAEVVARRPVVRMPGGPDVALAAASVAQVALLGALAATVGLTVPGWVVGLATGALTCGLLAGALHRAGARRLGAANAVTLTRAVLVGGVTALVAGLVAGTAAGGAGTAAGAVGGVALPVLAAVALALDGVDGQVARRTATASALGARFDMEVDAFLILVLSVDAARSAGAWVLAIGAMRYAFVAAGRCLPWLTGELAPRFSRKVVAAVQGVALVVSTMLPAPSGAIVLAVALALLVWSFAADVVALRRVAASGAVPVPPVSPSADRGSPVPR